MSGPREVSDYHANRPERIEQAAGIIGPPGGQKYKLFAAIYKGIKKVKSVGELSKVIGRNRQHVLTLCKILVRKQLIAELRGGGEIVGYSPLDTHKGDKNDILKYYARKKKPPTKRNPKATVIETRRIVIPKDVNIKPKVKQITIDDIDSFSKVRAIPDNIELLEPRRLSESKFKNGVKKILSAYGKWKDWGGENNDLRSGHLRIGAKRHTAAFAFKGPAMTGTLTPGKMGTNGDQIQRLFHNVPATVHFVQYEGKIADSVLHTMEVCAKAKAITSGDTICWCIIDMTDSHRLRTAYPKAFK